MTDIAAVLWDMDGTIVETEPYWIQAEYELAEKYGYEWNEQHAMELVGSDLIVSAHYIREHTGLDIPPEQIVHELLERVIARVRESVPWRPGARELLADLVDAGIPCALVTMSYLTFVEPVLNHLPRGTFEAVVTGDAVDEGKPHPEAYLTAAALLGVKPEHCLAIEDSNTGTRSAQAAGCVVLAVPNHVPVEPGERVVFRDTLVGLDSFALTHLLNAHG
ncbi:HAD family hydrolase [Nocardioides sp.]|uniref:HAD family hydrolase n=1 Tax=Nocardioides sp. TaxID=35761 RepID=UPI003D111C7E